MAAFGRCMLGLGALAFLLPSGVYAAEGPPTVPVDFDVVTTANTVVKLSTLVDTSKAIVMHLVTDQCAITEANLKILSQKATEFPDIQFVAVLRFVNGATITEFQCAADRFSCTADGGTTLAEVATYLPADTKVILVQDLYKEEVATSSAGAGGCADAGSNCQQMIDQGFDCPTLDAQGMGDQCKKTCNKCSAAELTTTPKPAFTPGLCCPTGGTFLSCGSLWNMFGDDGPIQQGWDIKEQIITYAPGGCRHGFVQPPSQPNPEKDGKVWTGDQLTKVTDAITAVSTASTCSGAAPSAGGAGPAPAPAPSGSGAGPSPAPTSGSDSASGGAPAPAAATENDDASANATAPAPAAAVASGYRAGGVLGVLAALVMAIFHP